MSSCIKRDVLVAEKKAPSYAKPDVALEALDSRWQQFFHKRGISQRTLERNQIAQDKKGNLAFPYLRKGELVNLKFRVRFKKNFYQSKDTEKVWLSTNSVH